MDKNAIVTESAPPPGGPYSQGVVAGDLIFVAGQGGLFGRFMPSPRPVRTTVAAGLAPGMRVEIDAIARRSS